VISVSADGSVDYAVNVGPVFPNGIIALPDDSVVWVESYTRRAMRRDADGAVTHIATLPERHMPDGFKASAGGDLYITSISSEGVDVVGLDGATKPFLATGGEPLNCLFVGTSLYITDGGLIPYTDPASRTANSGRLLRVDVGVEGEQLFSGRID
jgi:gluconolactonase